MSTVCGMTQAEAHPAELPNRQPGRAAKIAAIHMLANWFTEHPDAPMPITVLATYYVMPEDEPSDGVRMQDVEHVAACLDARLYPLDSVGRPERSWQFSHLIADDKTHGVDIEYRVAYIPERFAGPL